MRGLGILLGLLGLVPFLASAVGIWLVDEALFLLQTGLLYGAVILSFLGGVQWALAVTAAHAAPGQLAVAVVPSLIGWLGLIPGPLIGALAIGTGFFLVWGYEQREPVRKRLPAWYRRLRHALTVVVIGCHLSYALFAAGAG